MEKFCCPFYCSKIERALKLVMVFDSGITLQIALDCENEVRNQTWKQP